MKRITGHWTIEKFTISGTNHTQELNDSIQPEFIFHELSEYTSYKYQLDIMFYNNTWGTDRRSGRFDFENNNDILEVEIDTLMQDSISFCDNFNFLGPLFFSKIVSFDILKLTKHKLNIKTRYNNQDYYFEFLKQED